MIEANPGGNRDLSKFSGAGYDKGRTLVVQAVWFAVMNLVFSRWWCPAALRPWILRCFGAKVGRGVHIRHRVRVLWPWKLSIGRNSWVGEGAWLLNLEPITVGANVCLSQECLICTGSHDQRDPAFEFDNAPIFIGDGAWIAARAIVLRGAVVEPGETVPAASVRRARRQP